MYNDGRSVKEDVMAMGKRKSHPQQPLFIVAADLPQTPAHPFYRKLNEVLAADLRLQSQDRVA